jgi:hypothetical protein
MRGRAFSNSRHNSLSARRCASPMGAKVNEGDVEDWKQATFGSVRSAGSCLLPWQIFVDHQSDLQVSPSTMARA